VAGDIAGRLFSAEGVPCGGCYDERIIGIRLEDLRRIPHTVAVASGVEKAEAILGALRTGAVNVLCTDDRTATAVLAPARREQHNGA
jgi:DNA-binding transcriptional regulator LsrR (DeoR family)